MNIDLFSTPTKPHLAPIAERCRPKKLTEIIGHKEILGDQSIIMKAIEEGRLISCIFWGPPGVGKTTIARLIATSVDAHFLQLSAVSSGVKDLRQAIDKAKFNLENYSKLTVLFIDEIHRFNKAQQDALLHSVENGEIILIGATTENPSFEVNAALISRMQVFKLNPLSTDNLEQVIKRALQQDEVLKQYIVKLDNIDILLNLSAGDARKCLTLLETSVFLQKSGDDKQIHLLAETYITAAKSIKSAYDKSGENHYDTISAFIKSIRGSDPDAAIFWLARMIDGGEDPVFIARRLIISASEDIGNADPTALILAVNGLHAVHSIGMPEGRIILAQITSYLASTFKSNSSYKAVNSALEDIRQKPDISVPLHLRNAVTKLMKEQDYGIGYKYPHDFKSNFIHQDYFPDEHKNKRYYEPTENGREAVLKKHLSQLWDRHK